MSVFPAIIPSSSTYNLGVHAIKQREDLSGAEVRFLRSSVATRHSLDFTFAELTKEEAKKILDHYNSVRGSSLSFTISLATWCGDDFAEDYLWHYVATPTLSDVTPNTFACSLKFESVTSQTPRNVEGLPRSSETIGLTVSTAPLAPLVAQGVVIGQGHGSVKIESIAGFRLTTRIIQALDNTVALTSLSFIDYKKSISGTGTLNIQIPIPLNGDGGRYFLQLPTNVEAGFFPEQADLDQFRINNFLASETFDVSDIASFTFDGHIFNNSFNIGSPIDSFLEQPSFNALNVITSYASDPHDLKRGIRGVVLAISHGSFTASAIASYVEDPHRPVLGISESLEFNIYSIGFQVAATPSYSQTNRFTTFLVRGPSFAPQQHDQFGISGLTNTFTSSYTSDGHDFYWGIDESIVFDVGTMTALLGGETTLIP